MDCLAPGGKRDSLLRLGANHDGLEDWRIDRYDRCPVSNEICSGATAGISFRDDKFQRRERVELNGSLNKPPDKSPLGVIVVNFTDFYGVFHVDVADTQGYSKLKRSFLVATVDMRIDRCVYALPSRECGRQLACLTVGAENKGGKNKKN